MPPQLAAAVRPCQPVVGGLEAELHVSVPSDVAFIEEAVELVARHLEASFVDRRTVRFNLRVALTEALANAILYGNGEDASKRVGVRALFGPNTAHIEVTDEGGAVLNRLSMKIHRVDQRLPDGGWWTTCRTRIAPADGDSLGTTNPYIGHVILATGTLTGAENDPAVRSCATCF